MLDALFHALSDPTRRAMLERLSQGVLSVSELGQPFDMTPQAVSKHVRVLEDAGLVKRTVDGRVHRLSLEPKALEPVASWVSTYQRFWEDQMDALGAYVEELARDQAKKPATATTKLKAAGARAKAPTRPRPSRKSRPPKKNERS